ncbi:uncharacterized protein LOC126840398 [Adelges cooleyi]|uniref:uncharacterized protein LOC126840398 n=1 Tax=Adelges cooleyi TaxID=133065 RepID=UPI00217FD162|nr:uncharacterized protein LOC126840398 [Adelges cooleyi]XP_050432048.1 uncharacterized protein LOC126840398 [Adelges cooleyi]XP_050432049.1 uncharacterized protein LOC126840398 [Adelges cooleyi]XP_050432050.1 uncharacterized protein LOC126840398 [Adelges cooleyi]XP_050432052.1 uncharacterized protein LOC126840398 [Adelges cooleyi]
MATVSSPVVLANSLNNLNLNDSHENLTNRPNELSTLKRQYETIFSWDVYEKTGKSRNKLAEIIEKIEQKIELVFINKNKFSIDGFYLLLIHCFETFLDGNFSQALSEIEGMINNLKQVHSDDFYNQISDACFHITYASQAYIMIYMDQNIKEIFSKIKPLSQMNRAERAAINAVKCKVFMEYPPAGNKIALNFAESARNLNDNEVKWIDMWLKVKGRERRFDNKFTLPFREEFLAAEKLSTTLTDPELLIRASKLYEEAGFALKLSSNCLESDNYYKLASTLAVKAYNMDKDDIKTMYNCLEIFMDLPQNFMSADMIYNIAKKLSKTQNFRVDAILGKYFMKRKKDYNAAKHHLERAVSSGNFTSSLHLLKVECLLSSKFPVVQFLNSLYDVFTEPKRRLIIISQILLYYIYNESNPKQLLHFLDVYLDQDIDNLQKKHHINATFPLYQLKKKFNPKTFLNLLTREIENLKLHPNWDSNEKIILERVLSRFTATCNPERTEQNIVDALTCVVCLEIDIARVVLRPCGHRCLCKSCWEQLSSTAQCPLCRSVVTSTLIC